MSLILTNDQPRRAGLSRGNFRGQGLLKSITAKERQVSNNMPAKSPRKFKVEPKLQDPIEEEENIFREPDSYSSEEDEARIKAADILPTQFKSGSSKPAANRSTNTNFLFGHNGTSHKPMHKGKDSNAASRNTNKRSKGTKLISTSSADSSSTSSPKRKSLEDISALGASMADEHGFVKSSSQHKKQRRPGSSQPGYGRSSQKSKARLRLHKVESSDVEDEEPKSIFRASVIEDTPEKPSPSKTFKHPKGSQTNSTSSTPISSRKFKSRRVSASPMATEEEDTVSPFKRPEYDLSDDELCKNSPLRNPPITSTDDSPASPIPLFRLDKATAERAHAIIESGRDILRPVSFAEVDDYDFGTMTQRAICPMCNEPVDPADLRKYGRMNTRKQEIFCREHRRNTALAEWDIREYPTIEWDRLDSRISKHHSFIKKLINGAESHYRDLLRKRVDAGKDRSLLKTTTNLIPGYYGTRGLLAISENIMKEFTPLLKKRIVKDRLMSARGVTPYVQSVLVPEVAVLLIQQDMKVDVEASRTILMDSTAIGELLNEEVRDVIRKEDDDSEGDEVFDDN